MLLTAWLVFWIPLGFLYKQSNLQLHDSKIEVIIGYATCCLFASISGSCYFWYGLGNKVHALLCRVICPMPNAQPSTWRARDYLLVWLLPADLPPMTESPKIELPASTALKVIQAHKLLYHYKLIVHKGRLAGSYMMNLNRAWLPSKLNWSSCFMYAFVWRDGTTNNHRVISTHVHIEFIWIYFTLSIPSHYLISSCIITACRHFPALCTGTCN